MKRRGRKRANDPDLFKVLLNYVELSCLFCLPNLQKKKKKKKIIIKKLVINFFFFYTKKKKKKKKKKKLINPT